MVQFLEVANSYASGFVRETGSKM